MLKNLLAGFFSPVFCVFLVRCLLVSEWDAQTLEGLVNIRFLGPLLFLCSLIPKICGQFVPLGNCLPMQKQFDKLNLTGCALHWCGVPLLQILTHRETKSSRSTLFSALCALQYHALHILLCNIMHCTSCTLPCTYCIAQCISWITYSLQCHALRHTVQQCSTDVCIIYTFYSSGQN